MSTAKSSREKTAAYRKRQREKGLRLVQFWVPDTRSPEFLEEARRACEAINAHPSTRFDQEFIDAVSVDWDEE